MTNLSRIPKYGVHTVVTGPFIGVGVVDKNTGDVRMNELEQCHVRIRVDGEVEIRKYHQNLLARVSFLRWLFHRNPDGSYQVGNNSLWLFIGAMLIFVGLFIGVIGEPGPYAAAIRVLCIGTPILWLIFTGRQYLGMSR